MSLRASFSKRAGLTDAKSVRVAEDMYQLMVTGCVGFVVVVVVGVVVVVVVVALGLCV